MSYVKNLQNEKKQQKSKAINNIFKYVLGAITLFVVFFIILSFGMLIFTGIRTGSQSGNADWTEILFGKDFDMNGDLAMGIIIVNTIWMSFLVLLIATPVSIATAVFITRVIPKKFAPVMIAIVSILAAIPSVVYGSFGKYVLLKAMHNAGLSELPTDATLFSVILIISIMVMPTITLITTTSLMMVDRKMENSSEALGATKIQTTLFVTLRSAKTGIIVAMLFALGRCLGEATAISMLSGSKVLTEGITLNIMSVSLFMSPTIMYAFNEASNNTGAAETYEILSALLLIVVIIVFAAVKYLEFLTDDKAKSKKQSKEIYLNRKVNKKANKYGVDSLDQKQLTRYSNNLIKSYNIEKQSNSTSLLRANELSIIRSRTTIDNLKNQEKYKINRSIMYKAIVFILSMLGILVLISILGYLFSSGFEMAFNWDILTTKGSFDWDYDGYTVSVVGLAIPMFGTLITILVAMAIAIPLGISIAIFTHSYINNETMLGRFISFSFQIMTSIPAVIYGTIASIIFVATGYFAKEFKAFEPMLMLSLVILPTIIKQTNEGFINVKNSQVEGSEALGATKAATSWKIIIKQSIPAILAAAILSISIVMADSAIFITIIGQPTHWSNTDKWMENGGYTLATAIYWISAKTSTVDVHQNAASLEQIKAIGILLMLLIFWLTMIAQYIRIGNKRSAMLMTIGILLFTTSLFIIDGGVKVEFIIGAILGVIGLLYDPIRLMIKGKR